MSQDRGRPEEPGVEAYEPPAVEELTNDPVGTAPGDTPITPPVVC